MVISNKDYRVVITTTKSPNGLVDKTIKVRKRRYVRLFNRLTIFTYWCIEQVYIGGFENRVTEDMLFDSISKAVDWINNDIIARNDKLQTTTKKEIIKIEDTSLWD